MIIGFAGQKRSGKSTAASALLQLGWQRLSFADPLRAMLSSLLLDLGLSSDEVLEAMREKEEVIHPIGRSFRQLAQTLGTEWGRRQVDPDLWIKCAEARLDALDGHAVFDDVRFENEATLIRSRGGLIVHIRRPGLGDFDNHASEAGLAVKEGDLVLDNNSNAGLLLDAVLRLVTR